MPLHYAEQSLGAQTSYAELFDLATVVDSAKFASLQGSFHRRQIRGKTYVYFNFRDINGRGRAAYVGPESARVISLIDQVERSRASVHEEALARRAQASIALGCAGLPGQKFRMIQKLAGYGFFGAGAVLVGPYAYAAIGNMLGVRWVSDKAGHATNITFDGGHNIAIGVPTEMRIPSNDALTSLEHGLLPIREFEGSNGSRRRPPQDQGMPIDFLTPDVGRSDSVESSAMGFPLERLKFLELVIENSTSAVVFSKSGACLINVPDPARLALYLLTTSALKPPRPRSDSSSDQERAASLIQWHLDHNRLDRVQEVWQHLQSRGPVWSQCADEGLAAVIEKHPSLAPAFR